MFIQSLIKYKNIELYYSFVSQAEIEENPFDDIKAAIMDFIETNATAFVGENRLDEVKAIADKIMSTGIKPKDAAHIACAIFAGCDYFISTDKRLLKYQTNKIKLINPIEFMDMWRVE